MTNLEKRVPLADPSVRATGFPSPAEDYFEPYLDLNELLIEDRTSTYMVRVQGHSNIKDGFHPGDVLLVDRSKQAKNNNVIIAIVDGVLTIKRLKRGKGKTFLEPANQSFPIIEINEEMKLDVWGVVTYSIHRHL